MRRLYLAGPITGISYKEVMEKRNNLKKDLEPEYFVVDPMRGKESLAEDLSLSSNYSGLHMDPLLGGHSIFRRDYTDLLSCDVVLGDFRGSKKISIGSVMELAWAYQKGIYVITVMEPGNMHEYAFMDEVAGVSYFFMQEALHYLKYSY